MDPGAVRDNLARIRDEIHAIKAAEGLDQPVRIVAVTKGHGPWAVEAVVGAGLEDVGENRVQEALHKQDDIAEAGGDIRARWHLIGHLQTNKAKLIPGRFDMVHSVDSTRVADALDTALSRRLEAQERGAANPLEILLQVNVAGEQQKSGCPREEVEDTVAHVAGLERLRLRGLMTMAPLTDDESQQRRVFAGLREIRDRLGAAGMDVPELSMGMTGDFRAAVAEGATMVRLGTLLLGPRPS